IAPRPASVFLRSRPPTFTPSWSSTEWPAAPTALPSFSLLARAAASAVVRRASGAIRAFGIALRQRDQLVVAPLIAPNTSDAVTLFLSLAGGCAGPVRLDVPTR